MNSVIQNNIILPYIKKTNYNCLRMGASLKVFDAWDKDDDRIVTNELVTKHGLNTLILKQKQTMEWTQSFTQKTKKVHFCFDNYNSVNKTKILTMPSNSIDNIINLLIPEQMHDPAIKMCSLWNAEFNSVKTHNNIVFTQHFCIFPCVFSKSSS